MGCRLSVVGVFGGGRGNVLVLRMLESGGGLGYGL